VRLPIVSSEDVVRVLKRAGFSYAPKRGKGNHLAFYKKEQDIKRLVIVPKRKAIPKGTLSAILEQAGLSREKFLELLKR